MATFDNYFVMLGFFALVITGLVGIFVFDTVTTSDFNEQIWDKTSTGSGVRENARTFYNNLDTFMLMAWIGAHLSIIALGFALRSHPIVLVVVLLLSVVLVMIAAPIANVWSDEIITITAMSSAAADLPKVNFIMEKLPLFELIWAVLTGVILVGTARTEEFI